MPFTLGPRRGVYLEISEEMQAAGPLLGESEIRPFDELDQVYRALCAVMFNYVPMSGHPGGSISSGRFVARALYASMDYDLGDPERRDADIISYAAGHKALGLYAMWALRDEVARIAAPDLVPPSNALRLRLEDLLGFRRNPTTSTPLFRAHAARPLDGHPTPATPFVRLATGASGVGIASSIGLAFGARDYFGANAPRVHIIEGEGGLTPGRVAEALAAAGTASLDNVILHLDWNQASIDSDHVCREGSTPGDYVQWDPCELFFLHDWNVILVPDGTDMRQIAEAQRRALRLDSGQPTAIVYRTTKGWRYGIEGRASHGAGHPMCSEGFYATVTDLVGPDGPRMPVCDARASGCANGGDATAVEACYFAALEVVRAALEQRRDMAAALAESLRRARERLQGSGRAPRAGAPQLSAIYDGLATSARNRPASLVMAPGGGATLRAALGKALGHLNRASNGAILVAAADLLGSTSVIEASAGFPGGYYHTTDNPECRVLSAGGICEDAMCGMLSGTSAFGYHLGAGSSYGAFIAALGHVSARLHAIGQQARRATLRDRYRTFLLICAHAGLETGEDGPTHADPQALQLLQENFPRGTMITLTPWDPQEVWPLVASALAARPAVVAPFVTRPSVTVLDRPALGLAPAEAAAQGVYALRSARGPRDGTVVLQGSGITYAFVQEALPLLEEKGIDLDVFYVASAEIFDALPASEREAIFPRARADEAMAITGFTLPTVYRWIHSDLGREMSLHPFLHGHYLGSGAGRFVIAEAGLDGDSQVRAIKRYLDVRR